MSAALEVRGVGKNYGPLHVLREVDFTVGTGEIFAVIGPNGAGKTTLFRVLTGEAASNGGSVRLHGEDITRLTVAERVHRGVGRTFQVARIFPEFTALQNVAVAIEARRRFPGQPRARHWNWRPDPAVVAEARAQLDDLGLSSRTEVQARLLSHGDRKRLEFALMLSLRPSILMLDEPMAGTAADDRQTMAELILKVRRERQVTVVMTEHDMDVVFSLADRVMVLNYGQVIAVGEPQAVRRDDKVREVYLGREASHA